MELMNCPNLAVPAEIMHHVVRVESSYNPYAIGVVGGRLLRQPSSLSEALATARMLESRGYNFSLGLAQVNRYNLRKYGLDSYEKAFQVCPNLQAGSRILAECHGRSSGDWGRSFSCYYSGNFVTGFRHGYVQKVYASINEASSTGAENRFIEVVDRSSRRPVPVTRRLSPAPGQHLSPQKVEASPAPPVLPQPDIASGLPSAGTPAPIGAEAIAARLSAATPMGGAKPSESQSTADEAFVF